MPDAIDNAVNQAKKAASGAASNALNQASGVAGAQASTALAAATAAQAQVNAALENLPFDKDPDIIKRQKEAEIQQKKAQAEELLATAEEKAVEEGKKKLALLKAGLISLIPIPVIDPKVLAAVSLLKQARDTYKRRKKLVKKNIEEGRKLYKYDIKKEPPAPPPNKIPLVAPPAPPQQFIPIPSPTPAATSKLVVVEFQSTFRPDLIRTSIPNDGKTSIANYLGGSIKAISNENYLKTLLTGGNAVTFEIKLPIAADSRSAIENLVDSWKRDLPTYAIGLGAASEKVDYITVYVFNDPGLLEFYANS